MLYLILVHSGGFSKNLREQMDILREDGLEIGTAYRRQGTVSQIWYAFFFFLSSYSGDQFFCSVFVLWNRSKTTNAIVSSKTLLCTEET